MSQPLIYPNVSNETALALIDGLQQKGMQATPTTPGIWRIEGKGVVGTVQVSQNTLTVTITQKPFFVSESFIDSLIKSALGRS